MTTNERDDAGSPAVARRADALALALTGRDRADAELAERVGAVVEVEAEIARLHARRAILIDQTRHASEKYAESTVLGYTERSNGRRAALARLALVTELAAALHVSEPAAESLVAESELLCGPLPGTLRALNEGTISYRHAQVIADQASSLREQARPDETSDQTWDRLERDSAVLDAFEEAVLPDASTSTAARLRQKARRIRERVHPESIEVRRAHAATDRSVTFEPAHDGMGWLHLYGEAPVLSAAYSRINDAATGLQGPDEPRTLTQLRADVLCDALIGEAHTEARTTGTGDTGANGAAEHARHPDRSPEAKKDPATNTDPAGRSPGSDSSPRTRDDRAGGSRFAGIRPTVHVTVPVLSLLGLSDEPAQLDGYGPIDPDTARELCAEAPSFTRILAHPETGAVLSVGRDSYTVPADLRRALRVRDGTCRFPGCGRAAARSDLDHTLDWQYGGTTELTNLAHLCPKHHMLKHSTTWRVSQRPGGILEWISPAGRHHTTHPENTI
ncbi:hypothetical protein GCM10027416_32210 [Okibacterium endophyticum]